MKHLVLFLFLSLLISFFYFGCKQQVEEIKLTKGASPIHLSTKYVNYINTAEANLKVNNTYAFMSEDGKDYAVIVRNAYKFMENVEELFIVRANDNTQPKYFTIKNVENSEFLFEIYCISDGNWPDAPPRIIITSQ